MYTYVTNRHSSNNIQDSPQTSSKFNDPSVTGRPQQRPCNETHYNWIRIAEELHAGSWFVQANERKELSISNASEKKRTNAHTQHLQHSPKCNSNSMPSMYSVQTELVASQQREFHT